VQGVHYNMHMCNSGCTRAIDMNPKVEIMFSTIEN
jgi:hypothetical protein